ACRSQSTFTLSAYALPQTSKTDTKHKTVHSGLIGSLLAVVWFASHSHVPNLRSLEQCLSPFDATLEPRLLPASRACSSLNLNAGPLRRASTMHSFYNATPPLRPARSVADHSLGPSIAIPIVTVHRGLP